MLSYTRSVLLRWGGLTLLFAIAMAVAPGFWLRLMYGPAIVQYGYILRLYALYYVMSFVGSTLCAGLQALEFTAPIFWSYLATAAFAVALALPLAKRLGLTGTMLGLLGTQVVFLGIVSVALLVKSRRVARKAALAPLTPAGAE